MEDSLRKLSPSESVSTPRATDGRSFARRWVRRVAIAWIVVSFALIIVTRFVNASGDEAKVITALDTEYQAAVQKNDATTMGQIACRQLHARHWLWQGVHKADLLNEARSRRTHYERQDDTEQTVRLWGDTAVITAKLTAKGEAAGKQFEYSLWFSDTYVRKLSGWRYVFLQASSPLSK